MDDKNLQFDKKEARLMVLCTSAVIDIVKELEKEHGKGTKLDVWDVPVEEVHKLKEKVQLFYDTHY